jgi:hypothetical protein
MTKPLTVDTSRLQAAGETLHSTVFPPFPAPVAAAGTDAISAAINETMPIIEAPVADGLPAAKAALDQTATKMASAAAIYSTADQTLGQQLAVQQFADAQPRARATASPADTIALTMSAAADDAAAALTETDIASQVGQFVAGAGMATSTAQNIAQGVQGVQGVVGSFSAGATPAEDDENEPETTEDGAAAGEPMLESVPVHSLAGTSPAGSDRGGQRAAE